MAEEVKRYPHVKVTLVGQDGNAFNLIGLTGRALRKAGVPREEITAVQQRLMASGSYDELLAELMRTVDVQ